MSGLEVLGVLLAVIPLFISAAEHYQQGCGTTYRFFHKRRALDVYTAELRLQHTLLGMYLKELVGSTKLSPVDKATLVNDPSHAMWQSPGVTHELDLRLGSAKPAFLGNLETIVKSLLGQIKKDRLAQEGTADAFKQLQELKASDFAAAGSGTVLWDRIKISFKDPQKNHDLLTIRSCNGNLKKLLEAVEGAKGYQLEQDLHQAHRAYEVRQEAHTLFDALSRQCQCTIPHEPKIRTRPRMQCPEPDWNMWFEVLIHQPAQACYELSVGLWNGADQRSRAPRVKIVVDNAAPGGCPSNIKSQDQWRALGQLCHALDEAHTGNMHLEVAIDRDHNLWEVEAAPKSTLAAAKGLVSLEECLKNLSNHTRKGWFHREKAILSTILAHSLLQLHGSPWLTHRWSMRDILFLDDTSAAPYATAGFKLSRPYFSSPPVDSHRGTYRWGRHQNPSLLAFGVILLELYMSRSISPEISASSAEDVRPVLVDLLEDCYENDDLSEEYYNAIRFCLWSQPNRRSKKTTFDDPGFREKYYSEVVVPLERYLQTKVSFDEKFWSTL